MLSWLRELLLQREQLRERLFIRTALPWLLEEL